MKKFLFSLIVISSISLHGMEQKSKTDKEIAQLFYKDPTQAIEHIKTIISSPNPTAENLESFVEYIEYLKKILRMSNNNECTVVDPWIPIINEYPSIKSNPWLVEKILGQLSIDKESAQQCTNTQLCLLSLSLATNDPFILCQGSLLYKEWLAIPHQLQKSISVSPACNDCSLHRGKKKCIIS